MLIATQKPPSQMNKSLTICKYSCIDWLAIKKFAAITLSSQWSLSGYGVEYENWIDKWSTSEIDRSQSFFFSLSLFVHNIHVSLFVFFFSSIWKSNAIVIRSLFQPNTAMNLNRTVIFMSDVLSVAKSNWLPFSHRGASMQTRSFVIGKFDLIDKLAKAHERTHTPNLRRHCAEWPLNWPKSK